MVVRSSEIAHQMFLGRQVPSYLPDLLSLIKGTPRIKTAKQELPNLSPDCWVNTLKEQNKTLTIFYIINLAQAQYI